jgi:hypothetical protein
MGKRGISAFWALVLVVMLTACGSDSSDVPIPGSGGSEGSTGSPVPLALGVPRAGYAGLFPSYYYFQASVAGTYTITLTGVNADVSWDLYDPSGFGGSPIDWCDDFWSATDESCSTSISTTGTYYLEVINWDAMWGTPTATYFLTVTAPAPPPGCSGSGTCFDLEGGSVPADLVNSTGSDAAWTVDTAPANGTYSLRSGAIGDSQTSCFEYTPAGDTSSVSFNLMTDTEDGWDYLIFYIDGGMQSPQWSGATDWNRVTYSPALGLHTYKWCYEKDGSTVDGLDAVWVDDIEVQ